MSTAIPRRGTSVRIRSVRPSVSMPTAPFRSVRNTWMPRSRYRATTSGAGKPNRFPYPAETTARAGATASRNSGLLEEREPAAVPSSTHGLVWEDDGDV